MKIFSRNACCLLGLLVGGWLRAGEIEPPVPVRTVAPKYPADLSSIGISGLVVIVCDIDEKGAVVAAKVEKSSNEAFNHAAVEAVEKWKFRPAQMDGKPTAMQIKVPVKFTNDA